MTQKEFEKVLKYCRVIGIETLAELARFSREEREKGEGILQALERYYNSIINK